MFGQLIPWLSTIGRISAGHPRTKKVARFCVACREFVPVYEGPAEHADVGDDPTPRWTCPTCRARG